MSDPIVKGVKRSPSRSLSRQNSPSSAAKNRALAGKGARPKPLVKRSAAEKAPARKASKSNMKACSTAAAKNISAKRKVKKAAPARKSPVPKRAVTKAKAKVKAKAPARKSVPPARKQKKTVQAQAVKASKAKSKQSKKIITLPARRPVAPPPPPRKAAQEMFERALKREPQAAHIHYGLAATRSRLGSIETALQSLQRALELQPNLRLRAQHDLDLSLLRNDPEFERMIFAPRL